MIVGEDENNISMRGIQGRQLKGTEADRKKRKGQNYNCENRWEYEENREKDYKKKNANMNWQWDDLKEITYSNDKKRS